MTSTATETRPEVDSPRGYYGTARSGHVKNLLARSTAAGSQLGLTPEIIAKMRRHYQVASCLLIQSLPLIRADWIIECDDDAIAERLTEAYRAVAFDVHKSMTKALWAGYSPNTITWSYREDLRGIYPAEIRDLEPRTCEPAVDDDGVFDGIVQRVAGHNDETFDPIYCLWIAEGKESGNYFGRSLLDAALDPWADFAAFRAFHARYLERFGEPVVIARAPSGKSIANKEAIEAAVAAGTTPPAPVLEDNLDTALDTATNLRHHSAVALPSSLLFGADGKPTGFAWNLEFLEAKGGSGEDFVKALQECAQRIARAMFVPDLLANNTADTGSNALGQTHKSVWSESVDGRLDDYSRQVTDQLIEPARRLNFGEGSSPARLVFKSISDAERDRLWELLVALVTTGKLPVDGKALAEEYDLPVLDDVDPDTAPVEDPAPPAPDEPVTDEEKLRHAFARPVVALASDDPVAGLPPWKLPQSYDPPPFRRELNAREARVGFAAIEAGLNAAEGQVVTQLASILDTEHERVLRQLAAILKKGTEAEVLAALGTIELKAGPPVARAWTDLMGEVGQLAIDQIRGELADFEDVLPIAVGPKGRALFRSYAQTSADRAVTSLLTEVRLSLLNAYTSNVSRPGMAAIVGQVFDAYVGSEAKPVRLTTRMLSAKSLNYSRADAIERGGIPLAGAQYSAILDRRTCELCEELDEKVIPIEHTDLARFTPPVHHNCRCVWVWITRDEADFTPTWTTPAASKVDRFGGLVI